ncbi:hypothetical protein Q1695_010091 [Nippostrongylus brasiliensis]|nr:hypothetical protein Q1695_010091 [Nippostrongylus brasiliensis]
MNLTSRLIVANEAEDLPEAFVCRASPGEVAAMSAVTAKVAKEEKPGNEKDAKKKEKRKELRHRPVYHHQKAERDEEEHHVGYSRSGTDSLERKRASVSDEYKRRHRTMKETEKQRERMQYDSAFGYPIECYLVFLLLTSGLIAMLVVAISMVDKIEQDEQASCFSHVATPMSQREAAYSTFVAMTENIDCSTHMKHSSYGGRNVTGQFIMRQGLACIATTVMDATFGMYSTISMMLYRHLSFEGQVEMSLTNFVENFGTMESNETYPFTYYKELRTGLTRGGDKIWYPPLSYAWLEDRFEGQKHMSWWLLKDKSGAVRRSFRTPKSYDDYTLNNLGANFSSDRKWIYAKEDDTIGRGFFSAHQFLHNGWERDEQGEKKGRKFPKIRELQLHSGKRRSIFKEDFIVVFAPRSSYKLDTGSVLAAWIIAVVARAVEQMDLDLSSRNGELFLAYALLKAQQLSYTIYYKHWGNKTFTEESCIEEAAKIIVTNRDKYADDHAKIQRKKVNRVTSLALFTHQMSKDEVFMISLSLYTEGVAIIIKEGDKGDKREYRMTSTADLMIISRNEANSTQLLYLISVSGSYRTIEAAAMAGTRFFLQNAYPGQVVEWPAVYYHLSDTAEKHFYCAQDESFRAALYNKYGIECKPFPPKGRDRRSEQWKINDRVLKVASMDQSRTFVRAAISAGDDINAPIGK